MRIAKIHHNTIAKLARIGWKIEAVDGNQFVAKSIGMGGIIIRGQSSTMVADEVVAYVALPENWKAAQTADGTWVVRVVGDRTIYNGETLPEVVKEIKDKYRKARQADREDDEDGEEDEESDEDGAEDDEEGEEGEDHPDDEAAGEDDEEPEPKSVVKPKYKKAYQPHQHRCGDDLASRITAYVTYPLKGKKTRIDLGKLQSLAEANGAWQDRYATINPGMRRMNIANRLRALERQGKEIVWP